jgi:hypothetical protein
VRPDLLQLFLGRLVYEEPVAALDDVRFERIIRGFGSHYQVTSASNTKFSFERGEGYHRFERLDAFAYVDLGSVERLGVKGIAPLPDGNVIMMPPRFSSVRFTLQMRVIVAFWAFLFFSGWILIGGDALFWGIGFLIAYAVQAAMTVRSLRAKLTRWLARGSWN